MNLIVAKPDAVLAFMLFKGWRLSELNKMYYILTNPLYVKPEVIQFHIPKNEQAEDFAFQINNVVSHIARLYKWDKTLLLLFLSIKPDEIDSLFQEWLYTRTMGSKQENEQHKPAIQVSLATAS